MFREAFQRQLERYRRRYIDHQSFIMNAHRIFPDINLFTRPVAYGARGNKLIHVPEGFYEYCMVRNEQFDNSVAHRNCKDKEEFFARWTRACGRLHFARCKCGYTVRIRRQCNKIHCSLCGPMLQYRLYMEVCNFLKSQPSIYLLDLITEKFHLYSPVLSHIVEQLKYKSFLRIALIGDENSDFVRLRISILAPTSEECYRFACQILRQIKYPFLHYRLYTYAYFRNDPRRLAYHLMMHRKLLRFAKPWTLKAAYLQWLYSNSRMKSIMTAFDFDLYPNPTRVFVCPQCGRLISLISCEKVMELCRAPP